MNFNTDPSFPTRLQRFIAGVVALWKKWEVHERVAPHVVFSIFIIMVLYAVFLAAPPGFPDSTLLKVKKGATVDEVAQELAKRHIIHSSFLYKLIERVYGGVVAGEYAFSKPQNIITIAARLAYGDYQISPVRITVSDGMSSSDIAQLLQEKLIDFDAQAFYALASLKEGHLFPDTYFFFPGDEPELVVDAMVHNFNNQIRAVPVALVISQFGKPLEDVLTMASLLEREAADLQNRRIIAGILWKRITLDMPLQVDAAFLYINGKNTFELTTKDLAIDSPYNTYTHKGLPPGPIGNPSIDALMAAATPIKTNYLYYLSDKTGILHFSATYAEHLKNKKKYLGT